MKKTVCCVTVMFLMISYSFCLAAGEGQGKGKEEQMKELIKAADVPISFYGRVIDQNGDPVEDAQVEIQMGYYDPTVPLYFKGIKKLLLNTDRKGYFELKNQKGDGVFINKIQKKRYEFRYDSNTKRSFEYSAHLEKDRFKPDLANPVIFTMRKKEAATLVFKHDFSFGLNEKNMYEQVVDVVRGHWGATGKVGKAVYYGDEQEDLIVKAVLSKDKNSFTVSFSSTDKGGGILEREELLYVVPESGYEAVHTIQVPVKSNLKKYLYLKGRQGGMFARIDLELQGSTEGVGLHMTTWANPKGGRSVDYYPEIEAEEDRRIYKEKKQKAIEREERKKLKQQKQ